MRFLTLILIVLMLVSCQSTSRVSQVVQEGTDTPTQVHAQATIDPSNPTSVPNESFFAPASTSLVDINQDYPTQGNELISISGPQPFHECDSWPGLVGCSTGATVMPVRIAYYNPVVKRLVYIDLANGEGWQLPMEPSWPLSWSPNGERLLAVVDIDPGEARTFSSMVFDRQGQRVERSDESAYHCWQPEGASLARCDKDGLIRSLTGQEAWIDHNTQTDDWWLKVRAGPNEEEKIIKLPGPMNFSYHYHLYAWLPGTSYLIFYRSAIGTSTNFYGKPMYILDTRTGLFEDPAIDSHFGRWDTVLAGNLLITVNPHLDTEEGFPKLVIYNWRNRKQYNPLPGPMYIQQLAVWPQDQPEWVAFSALVSNTSGDESKRLVPSPGIYLFHIPTGEIRPVVNTGGSFQWMKWVNNGAVLLYGSLPDQPSRESYADIYAYRLLDKTQWLIGHVPIETLQTADAFMATFSIKNTP